MVVLAEAMMPIQASLTKIMKEFHTLSVALKVSFDILFLGV